MQQNVITVLVGFLKGEQQYHNLVFCSLLYIHQGERKFNSDGTDKLTATKNGAKMDDYQKLCSSLFENAFY